MTIIQRELERGVGLTEEIMVGKRPWSDLFIKHTFFTAGYKYYISVISASKNKEAHKTWSGYVESKVRMLVQKIEQHPSIQLAQAFNKGYDRRHRCKNDDEIERVQEGSLDYLVDKDSVEEESKAVNGDATPAEVEAKSSNADTKPTESEGEKSTNETEKPTCMDIYTTTHYIGLELDPSTSLPPLLPPCGRGIAAVAASPLELVLAVLT